MNNEDIIFNCGTFSTDGNQLVMENPTSQKVEEGPAFEGKAETFNSATIPVEIQEQLKNGLDARLTAYAINMKQGNLDKNQVAEK